MYKVRFGERKGASSGVSIIIKQWLDYRHNGSIHLY